jgi:hypothetical protein
MLPILTAVTILAIFAIVVTDAITVLLLTLAVETAPQPKPNQFLIDFGPTKQTLDML